MLPIHNTGVIHCNVTPIHHTHTQDNNITQVTYPHLPRITNITEPS